MSGYARAAHALGASVSGSDRAPSAYLDRLREEGVLDAHIGHDAANLPLGENVEVIYSSAVPAENPERVAARERDLPDRPRAELLAELTSLRRTIAVAGAHGKTTTASMIVHVLRESGLDPSWLVGSSVGAGLANSYWSSAQPALTCMASTDLRPTSAASNESPPAHPGAGGWLVVEADESDRSMLSLNVEIAVLTNVELDHHATFASLEQLREAFRQFLAKAPRAVIWDRPELHALREGPAVFYDAAAPELGSGRPCFTWRGGKVRLAVPGAHNALNATAALEVARLIGVERSARTAIASFTGAARRFQRLGTTASGAVVIDDYAHHPTEVAATLSAARTLGPRRLVAVFQPHLYSRTELLAREFGEALALADVVVMLDIYSARERAEDHPGVSGETLVRATIEHAHGREVLWRPGFEEAQATLGDLLVEGDMCVVMGAGNVDVLARRLAPGEADVLEGRAGAGEADLPERRAEAGDGV